MYSIKMCSTICLKNKGSNLKLCIKNNYTLKNRVFFCGVWFDGKILTNSDITIALRYMVLMCEGGQGQWQR